jgi:mannosyl-oligosaccharide alpha-1,2-mannosidase
MILMNLTLQYEQAKQHVSTIDFTHGSDGFVPFFEAIIRYLGGLLSVYSLTKEPIFLSKADEIGRALLPVFNTTSGVPAFAINPITKAIKNQEWNRRTTLLSEMVSLVHLSVLLVACPTLDQFIQASCQVEYKYLAHLTGRKEYFSAVRFLS